ncbi:MAG: YlxR family protein [Armatimonadota bacterium]
MSSDKRPIRTCIACRSSDDKKELLRVVKNSTGEVAIDPTGKKPGRGAYICRSEKCLTAAVKKKGFERALRTVVPAELIDDLKRTVQENEKAGRR